MKYHKTRSIFYNVQTLRELLCKIKDRVVTEDTEVARQYRL